MKNTADLLLNTPRICFEYQNTSVDTTSVIKEMIKKHYDKPNQTFENAKDTLPGTFFIFDYDDEYTNEDRSIKASFFIEYNNGIIQVYIQHEYIMCDECSGTGEADCVDCFGFGCEKCDEEGKIDCDSCLGDGWYDEWDNSKYYGAYTDLDKKVLLKTINLSQGELF